MLGQMISDCIHMCGHRGFELAECIRMMIRNY